MNDNPLDENGYPVYGVFGSKRHTAVEWLVDSINQSSKEGDIDFVLWKLKELLEQAKQMEKEQIIDAYKTGAPFSSEIEQQEYYNETYNQQQKP